MSRISKKASNAPKVSVLMPIYNTPIPHLRESIESILAQNFEDFEYLILNDSPENTKIDKIIESYSDIRIKYLKNESNVGLEASTNRLIDEARGEYLAIFDHDDISLPERLQREVDFLDANPKYGVVSAQFRLFGLQNFDTGNPLDSKSIKATLLTASCVSHTTAMFRKSVLIDNNIRYEKDYFPAASYRIITRLALVTEVQNLPEVLLRYRMDGNNTSLRNAEKRILAREKVSNEYGKGLIQKAWGKRGGKFDKLEQLGVSDRFKDSRYYKAERDGKPFFIKSDGKDLKNEYLMSKVMYKKSANYFVKPIDYRKCEVDYLAMQWSKGITLEDYLKHNTTTKKQKVSFIRDLYTILELLREENIVHRDITPRNILVVSEKLKLIDFHFAVRYDKYQELDYVTNNIDEVSMMGEPFSAGLFKWDDAFSLTRIAELIAGEGSEAEYPVIKKISAIIAEREIIPDGALLREVVVEQRQVIENFEASALRVRLKLVIKGTLGYRAARRAYRLAKKRQ